MTRRTVIRYVLYGFEILLALLVQVTPYVLPEIYGGKAVLLLPLTLSFAVFEKEIPAMVLAVVCGLLTDCSYSGALGFYVIAFVIMSFTISNLYDQYIRRSLLTVMMMAVVAVPLIIVLQFLFYYVLAGYSHGGMFFVRHYLSRILYTLAFVPVFFGLNRFVFSRTAKKGG